MTEYKKGTLVRVNSIEKTHIRHGLDSNGNMKNMVGKVFRVDDSFGGVVYINNRRKSFAYSWHPGDLTIVKSEDPDPIIFSFDVDKLEV